MTGTVPEHPGSTAGITLISAWHSTSRLLCNNTPLFTCTQARTPGTHLLMHMYLHAVGIVTYNDLLAYHSLGQLFFRVHALIPFPCRTGMLRFSTEGRCTHDMQGCACNSSAPCRKRQAIAMHACNATWEACSHFVNRAVDRPWPFFGVQFCRLDAAELQRR